MYVRNCFSSNYNKFNEFLMRISYLIFVPKKLENKTGDRQDSACEAHVHPSTRQLTHPMKQGNREKISLELITKTCLYNFDPLKPHFYIVNGVYRGKHYFCYFCSKNIDCGYATEPPRRGGSNECQQSMF